MELTNQLKKIIEELYNTTPENVHSVSLGYKYINNVKTKLCKDKNKKRKYIISYK